MLTNKVYDFWRHNCHFDVLWSLHTGLNDKLLISVAFEFTANVGGERHDERDGERYNKRDGERLGRTLRERHRQTSRRTSR